MHHSIFGTEQNRNNGIPGFESSAATFVPCHIAKQLQRMCAEKLFLVRLHLNCIPVKSYEDILTDSVENLSANT